MHCGFTKKKSRNIRYYNTNKCLFVVWPPDRSICTTLLRQQQQQQQQQHTRAIVPRVCVCVCLPCFVAVVIEYQIEQKIIPPPPSITEERPSQSRSFLWSRKKWWLGSKTSELWNCSVFLIVLPHARRLQRGWKGVKAELDTSTKNGNVYGFSTPHLVCTGLEIVLFLFTRQLVPIIHRLKKFLVQNYFL